MILVVEDNNNDFFVLQLAFEQAGFRHKLYRARDGKEAINFLKGTGIFCDRETFPFPDLLLLDLKPATGGSFEVLTRLQDERIPYLPVVLMSAFLDPKDIRRAQELGAQDYLLKPTHFEKVMELARALDADWLRRKW